MMLRIATLLLVSLGIASAQSVSLSDAEALAIGKRIWKNECAGTVSGLTSWNGGEAFASLGIGHFIWYPTSDGGPFEESFPKLIAYFQQRGIRTEKWMGGLCPWKTRAEFMKDFDGARLRSLRALLADNVGAQARFCAQRLEQALPKMLSAAPKSERERALRRPGLGPVAGARGNAGRRGTAGLRPGC